MKAKKWLSLLLVMALALPLMGPAAAIATTYDPSGLPVAPPVVSPQRPPDQQAPPAAESYASDPSLKAFVDKTEARTGDTLVFSAAMSGGAGKQSFALWVFRDGERVHTFHSGRKASWTYVPEYEGIYYGMAVGNDDTNKTQYKRTSEITVTLNDAEEAARQNSPLGMGGGGEDEAFNPYDIKHLLRIGPMNDISILETDSFSVRIPIEADAYFFEPGGGLSKHASITVEGAPQGEARAGYAARKSGNGRVSHEFFYEYLPFQAASLTEEQLVWEEEAAWNNEENAREKALQSWQERNGKTRPDDSGIWTSPLYANKQQRVFQITITAACKHPLTGDHSDTASFNLRILRDANRNGIADIEEPRQVLAFYEVPDVVMEEAPSDAPHLISVFPNIEIKAYYTKGNRAPPLRYQAEGMPQGITFEMISGEQFPVYRFRGTPVISNWLQGEAKRDFRMKVTAIDKAGNTGDMTLKLTVLRRSDSHLQPDIDLSIAPVPNLTLLAGQKTISPDVYISVLTNSSEPISMNLETGYIFWDDDKPEHPGYEPVGLGELTKTIYVDASHNWPQDYQILTNWYLVNQVSNISSKWGDTTFQVFPMRLTARQGDKIAFGQFSVTVLRDDTKNGKPDGQFYFNPVVNKHVIEDETLPPVQVSWVGPVEVSNLRIQVSPAVRGVRLNQDTKQIEFRPYISDWQEGETARKHLISILGEGGTEKHESSKAEWSEAYQAARSFTLTVYRRYEDYDRDFEQVASQTIDDGEKITPFIIRAKPGPVPMYIKSVTGYPLGVQKGPGGYYEGMVKISDWQENETQRVFEVVAKGAVQPNLGEEFTQFTRWQEMRFTITVMRIGLGSAPQEEIQEMEPDTQPLLEEIAGPEESPEQLPEETAEQPDVGEAPPEEAADLPPESSAEAPTPPEQAEQQQPPAQEVKEEEPSKHPGGKTGQPPAQPAEETALSEGDTQNLPVKLEDLTPESTRFTAGQKALPRLGILLPDDRKDALDVYQGIITSLLHAGYVPNDNLMILVVSAKGMEGKPAEEKAALLKKMGCQLVIAVGDQMSKSARKALGDLPLVAAGVDDPFAYHFVDRQGKARGAVTGVINTPLFENLLTLIGQMQPGAGQAGVFYNLESNQVKQRRAAMDAAGIGMLYGRISATSPFEPVMKKNLAEANLFVVDQSVNERAPDELQSLVTAAAQADKPVYGTSLRQVEAGFAAACTPDYQAVGYESGRLAALILGGQPIAELPFIQLEAYLIHTNPRTLDALGLQAPLLPPAGEQVSVQKTAPGQ